MAEIGIEQRRGEVVGNAFGELDEEVATGRVTEVKDKFSVVELSSVSNGNQVKVKDRVVVRYGRNAPRGRGRSRKPLTKKAYAQFPQGDIAAGIRFRKRRTPY